MLGVRAFFISRIKRTVGCEKIYAVRPLLLLLSAAVTQLPHYQSILPSSTTTSGEDGGTEIDLYIPDVFPLSPVQHRAEVVRWVVDRCERVGVFHSFFAFSAPYVYFANYQLYIYYTWTSRADHLSIWLVFGFLKVRTSNRAEKGACK